MAASNRQTIFEYIPAGNAVKLNAVDVETGLEVCIQGPVHCSRSQLETTALEKLKYALRKKGLIS